MIPFLFTEELPFKNLDYLFVPGIRTAIRDGLLEITAYTVDAEKHELKPFTLRWDPLTDEEKQIILDGCLINYNKEKLLKHTPHSHMRKDARMNLEESMAMLNDRQREAVNHVDGPMLVVAGPGTGKT